MIQEVITVQVRTIKTEEGKVLTNGKAYSDPGGKVYLASNDSADNWYEITEEEYQNILQAELEAQSLNLNEKI